MFDECAGNFKHKRLKALIWLAVVVLFFVVVRAIYIARLPSAPAPAAENDAK